MSLTQRDFTRLLRVLDVTASQEIDCAELLQRVAGFIERFDPQAAAPRGYEAVAQHLAVCPECLEEFEALYEWFRAQNSEPPA